MHQITVKATEETVVLKDNAIAIYSEDNKLLASLSLETALAVSALAARYALDELARRDERTNEVINILTH